MDVPDVRWVDWQALKDAGFKGVVFDKDNTLTVPYARAVHPPLEASLEECKRVFGKRNLAVFSNSAGLAQYDPDGSEADGLEEALGVRFIRHKAKKPAGGAGEVEEHFECSAHQLVMVGDRYLTDVVYGNRHGMLTVRCAPFHLGDESASIRAARAIEEFAVGRWTAGNPGLVGDKAHRLLGEEGGGTAPRRFVNHPGLW